MVSLAPRRAVSDCRQRRPAQPDARNHARRRGYGRRPPRTGIPHALLLLETRSRNTSENARLSYNLAHPKPGETWLLVTSAFHMRRAMASFERAGWEEVVRYPVDYRAEGFLEYTAWVFAGHLDTLDLAIKEWVGIWAYAASGR